MNATNTSPATNDTGAVDALIETRLAMAALIGHLCELAERHKVGGRGIERAITFYETGDLWLGEAIEGAREG